MKITRLLARLRRQRRVSAAMRRTEAEFSRRHGPDTARHLARVIAGAETQTNVLIPRAKW
jgi:hypothetical protein